MFHADPIDPDKVAVYIRWSTDDQGHGTTPEVQKEACEYYCRSQGWRFREELVFVDDGYSGGTLTRPALTRLRAAVRSGDIACVVVYKLDRLSRSVIDTVNLVLQEWEGRCHLKSTREPVDTSTATGKQFFYILVSYAEWERSVIRERTLGGKRKRAQQGRNAGQKYPFGYRKGGDGNWTLDGWDGESGSFVGPAAVVRRIFQSCLSGLGLHAIAEMLNREGILTPTGSQWRSAYIARILSNPAYAGTYRYGMRKGRNRKAGPPEFEVTGAIPPIVSEEEFQAVRRLRSQRETRPERCKAGGYLLSGIARCARCGCTIAGSLGKTKRYYVCTGRAIHRSCDCAYLDAGVVERSFLAEVRRAVAACPVSDQVDRVRAELGREVAGRAHAVAAAESEMAASLRRRRRLEDEFLNGALDGRTYAGLSARVEEEAEQAEGRLRRTRQALAEAQASAGELGEVGQAAGRVDAWAELGYEETKQLLRELTASLTLYQNKALTSSKKGNPNTIFLEWRPRTLC